MGHCAPSAPCSGTNNRCICRDPPPLAGRRFHARGRSARKKDKVSHSRESPSSLQMPPRTFSIWKGASPRFQKNYFLCRTIESLPTRKILTVFSLPSQATEKASMHCQPILNFPSHFLWRGNLCFFRSLRASKPSTRDLRLGYYIYV